MKRARLPIVGVLLLLSAAPVHAQQATPPLTRSSASRLLTAALQGSGSRSSAASSRILNARAEEHVLIFEALSNLELERSGKRPPKRTVLEFDAPGSNAGKAPCIFRLPSRYSGKNPVPVLFRMHGSGSTAEGFERDTNGDSAFNDFLLVTPQIPSKDRLDWNGRGCLRMLDAIYDHVLETYAVDEDRVYLSGFSAGSGMSMVLAETWPHRFAGFYAMSLVHHAFHLDPKGCMDVLAHVPGFFVVGENDDAERVRAYCEAEQYYEVKKLPGIFHCQKNKGHTLMPEFNREATAHLSKSRRKRYPRSFSAYFFCYEGADADRDIMRRQYWLEADAYDLNGTACKVRVDGNTIDVTAPRLQRGQLYLNDLIVDLEKEVEVRLNGRTVARENVRRSVAFLLNCFKKDHDRGQLYWNRVAIRSK